MANAISLLIHAGAFYAIQFQFVNRNTATNISDPYQSWLSASPAIALKMWGVIYTLLAIFCLYHIRMAWSRSTNHNANNDTSRANILFILNNLAGAGWLVTLAGGQESVPLVLLAIQLGSLIIIHQRLHVYKRDRRFKSNIYTQIPLSIYLGWLSVLAVATIDSWLQLTTDRWKIVLVSAIIFISLLVMFIRHNIFFGLAVIVALYGMIVKLESYKTSTYDSILAAWIGIGILALASVIKLTVDFRLRESPQVYQRPVYD
jgi:hypothetical protein